MSYSIRVAPTRLGDGSHPDVVITVPREVLNDISTLLLTLPAEDFGKWKFLSDQIDRFMAGYDYNNQRTS